MLIVTPSTPSDFSVSPPVKKGIRAKGEGRNTENGRRTEKIPRVSALFSFRQFLETALGFPEPVARRAASGSRDPANGRLKAKGERSKDGRT